jgi:hypothetical protein
MTNYGTPMHLTSFDYKDEAWMEHSVCVDTDPEWFYLPHNMRSQEKRAFENRALSICGTCPVKKQCLEYAYYTRDEYAIMGQTTPEMRKAMNRRLLNPRKLLQTQKMIETKRRLREAKNDR